MCVGVYKVFNIVSLSRNQEVRALFYAHLICKWVIQLSIIVALSHFADNKRFTSRVDGSCLYQCLGATQSWYSYILNLSTCWRCVVKFTVGQLYSQGRDLCTHQKGGWVVLRDSPNLLENKETSFPCWKLWVTWVKSKLHGALALFRPFDSDRILFNACIHTKLFWKSVSIKRNACDHILPCTSVDSRRTYSFVHLLPLFMHGVWNNFTGEYIMHNLFLWGHWKSCGITLQLDDICSWRMRQTVPPQRL